MTPYQVRVFDGRTVTAVHAPVYAASRARAAEHVRLHLTHQTEPPRLRYESIAVGRVVTLTHAASLRALELLRTAVSTPGRIVRRVDAPYSTRWPYALHVQGMSLPAMRELARQLCGTQARVVMLNGRLTVHER